ncbi:MAG: hypothetical protein JXA97_03330 [Anaerolineales bacterium]|nr:hypothetical protein [Anaerolineales bacterium]
MGRKNLLLALLFISIMALGSCGEPPSSKEPTPAAEDTIETMPAIIQSSPTPGEYSWNQAATAAPPTPTPPPAPTSTRPEIELQHLQMVSVTNGFAQVEHIDQGQRLLRTEDGGNSWMDITPPDGPDADLSYYFYDSSHGWVSYRATSDGFSSETYTIWRTTDGGSTWQRSAAMDLSDIDAEGVFPGSFVFLSPQVGWFRAVVGPHGMNQAPLTLYRTMDGGRTWQRMLDPYSNSNLTSFTITGMVFSDASFGWVTRDSHGVEAYVAVQITEDGGETWTSLNLPEPAESPGLFGSGNWCATRYPQLTGRGQGSLVVWCKDYRGEGFAYESYRYTTSNGGASWTYQSLPSGTLFTFSDAFVVASSSAYNAEENAIYASEDSGGSWNLIRVVDFFPGDWHFVDPLHGWVAASWEGGRRALMHTTDGGQTWSELDASFMISTAAGREVQNVEITSINMINAFNGWGIGSHPDERSCILTTPNGGQRWIDVTPAEVRFNADNSISAATFFLDVNHAWVAYASGSHGGTEAIGIWRTADGGTTWMFHMLPAVGDAGSSTPLYIFFLNEETGWYLVDIGPYTLLYGTRDGGITWTSLFNPYTETQLQAADKTGMAFFDASHGWITADNHTEALDDYVLMTSDGGQTWVRSVLPDSSTLIGYSYICGTYWPELTSPESGSIIYHCTHRYHDPPDEHLFLFETVNEGETWTSMDYPGGQPVRFNSEILYALGADMFISTDGGESWDQFKTVAWSGQFSFINEEQGWAVASAGDEVALVRTEDGGLNWGLIDYAVFEGQ